jgi:hypothetical protein
MAEIYGLASTRNGRIRYVGETGGSHGARFAQHYWGKNSVKCVQNWAKVERISGFDIYSITIEHLLPNSPQSYRQERETHWLLRVENKINERKDYSWLVIPEHDRYYLQDLEAKNKLDVVENWHGYIGVRYVPRWKAWRVGIQAANSTYFHVDGDGGTFEMTSETFVRPFGHIGYLGDKYFCDPNDAIKARYSERERLNDQRDGQIRAGIPLPHHDWPDDLDPERTDWEDIAA